MGFEVLANKVMNGSYLSREELDVLAKLVQNNKISDCQFVAILTAMQTRDEILGRSIEESSSFVDAFRVRADYKIEGVLCNSGTGGDRIKTLNISTPASIVIASADIRVLKTGSKGTTGSKGSREAFEALGIDPLRDLEDVIDSTMSVSIGYYDFSKLIPIHGRSGLRTPLNFMGPLCHPTQLTNKVLGCADKEYAYDATRILDTGLSENYFVSYNPNVDELSLVESSLIIEKRTGEKKTYDFDPRSEGLPIVKYEHVAKSDDYVIDSKKILDALAGNEPLIRHFIALNAGAGIYLAGKARNLSEGFEIANELMKSGKAYEKLIEWRAYQHANP